MASAVRVRIVAGRRVEVLVDRRRGAGRPARPRGRAAAGAAGAASRSRPTDRRRPGRSAVAQRWNERMAASRWATDERARPSPSTAEVGAQVGPCRASPVGAARRQPVPGRRRRRSRRRAGCAATRRERRGSGGTARARGRSPGRRPGPALTRRRPARPGGFAWSSRGRRSARHRAAAPPAASRRSARRSPRARAGRRASGFGGPPAYAAPGTIVVGRGVAGRPADQADRRRRPCAPAARRPRRAGRRAARCSS